MKTVMTKIDLVKIEKSNILGLAQQASGILEAGGLIVAPTETRYGLLCRADDGDMLQRLYEIKGRPSFMPCSVFVKSMEQLSRWVVITKKVEKIAAAFWPGSVTMVLEAKADFPEPVVSEGKIGIRFSPEPFIVELLKKVDFPVTATSANFSGAGDMVAISEIVDSFENKVDLYLDGGARDGATSTVVDMTTEPPKLLRSGAVEFEKIMEVIKDE